MDFALSQEHQDLRLRCRELAADFATRAAAHDREASHPVENYRILRDEGFLALNVPEKWGGAGVGLLGHTIAFEALAAIQPPPEADKSGASRTLAGNAGGMLG